LLEKGRQWHQNALNGASGGLLAFTGAVAQGADRAGAVVRLCYTNGAGVNIMYLIRSSISTERRLIRAQRSLAHYTVNIGQLCTSYPQSFPQFRGVDRQAGSPGTELRSPGRIGPTADCWQGKRPCRLCATRSRAGQAAAGANGQE